MWVDKIHDLYTKMTYLNFMVNTEILSPIRRKMLLGALLFSVVSCRAVHFVAEKCCHHLLGISVFTILYYNMS